MSEAHVASINEPGVIAKMLVVVGCHLPGAGSMYLVRTVVVRRLLSGGAEKGPSFSYSRLTVGRQPAASLPRELPDDEGLYK